MKLKEVISKIREPFEVDYSLLTEMERFSKIRMHKAPSKVYNYLKFHFNNLHIEIAGKYQGNLMDLMEEGLLEGWCWQTTETASLFLDDESYIERGHLRFDLNKLYYHSWIIFMYDGVEYVFDPCLQILCPKLYYYKIFEISIKGHVTAREVKEYFISYVTNPPKKETNNRFESILKSIVGESVLERTKGEIVIQGEENPNSPMYRNGVGYKPTLENNQIKKLVAHYYINDC